MLPIVAFRIFQIAGDHVVAMTDLHSNSAISKSSGVKSLNLSLFFGRKSVAVTNLRQSD